MAIDEEKPYAELWCADVHILSACRCLKRSLAVNLGAMQCIHTLIKLYRWDTCAPCTCAADSLHAHSAAELGCWMPVLPACTLLSPPGAYLVAAALRLSLCSEWGCTPSAWPACWHHSKRIASH